MASELDPSGTLRGISNLLLPFQPDGAPEPGDAGDGREGPAHEGDSLDRPVAPSRC